MIEALSVADKGWLQAFFSGRNSLKWNEIVNQSASPDWLEQVVPWITNFASSFGKLPIVLPVFGCDGPERWYAMASDESTANALSQELTAFIGPSYSDFRGRTLDLDPDDTLEQVLVERFGRFVFQLAPVDATDSSEIIKALHLYLNILRRRPDIPNRARRPFGKIRAEFDRALLAGNESDAENLRAELVGTGRINSEQEKYLEIRMLAGLGHQSQLAHNYPLIKSVVGLPLPAQTIADLVVALYSTHIADLEGSVDDEVILNVFRQQIANTFGALFTSRKGVMHPSVLKAFILFELVQAKPNRERCQAIVSVYPEHSGRELVERWLGRLSESEVLRGDELCDAANLALIDEDYELALRLSFEALPDPWTYSMLLRCAVEIEDSEIARRVLAKVDAAPEAQRLKFNKRDLDRVRRLREFTLVDNCSDDTDSHSNPCRPEVDWLSWVSYVESGVQDVPALQILEQALPRWSVEAYASDPGGCKKLAEKIGNASGDAESVIREAFASLVEFFIDRPTRPSRAFVPLYAMLIKMVAWNGTVTANELELASSVVQGFVNLAPSKEDYAEAIDAYSEILTANSSPSSVDWALNAAEMLALNVCPDMDSRLRFFMTVVDMVRSFEHRLSQVQYELLDLLAKDFDCSDLMESFPRVNAVEEEKVTNVDFSGLIGIYTLTEQAGLRAQQFLRKLFPKARVGVNADHVATEKLRSLAANADIFVFAWKSSKHQAYFAVKAARADKRILLPLGKGSASIIDSVMGELELSV